MAGISPGCTELTLPLTRIVDEDVDLAVGRERGGDGGVPVRLAGDVETLKRASPLLDLIESATAWPSASSMSATMTLAPSRANSRAVAAPIPDAAPVTMATLSCKRMASALGSGIRSVWRVR
jgi:hypothetical protein